MVIATKADAAGTAGVASGGSFALGAAVNAEYTQKYGFDASARITAKMVVVPPPVVMLREMGVADEVITAILARWPMPGGGLAEPAKLMQTDLGRSQ